MTVHEAGFTADGRGFLVMEYLAGGTLAAAVDRDGSMAWAEVARIGVHLAGALETAHQASVLHRDIKPDNVLLSAYGEPKLADFGIARLVGGTATRTGPVYASVMYAAPEILAGLGPSTPASDVYALGGTLLTLLTRHPPFVPREDEPIGAFIARIVSTPPDLQVPEAHPALLAALGRALSKDPSARQSTARELGESLRDVQRETGEAATEMAIGRLGAEETPPRPPADDPGQGVPWLKPRPTPPSDHVFVRAVRLSGDFSLVPSVSVQDATGASACPEPQECVLKASGRHTLVVQNMVGPAAGSYALYLQRTDMPVGCGAIALGEAADGALMPPGSLACVIFSAAAGDRVRVNVVGTGDVPLQFSEVNIREAAGGGSACPVQQNCQLDRGGRYIVLAASPGFADRTGPYRITVTCLAGPCRGG